MRRLFLLIPAVSGLLAASCSESPLGCNTDQDCHGSICDVGRHVCVAGQLPDGGTSDLLLAPDLSPLPPDMSVMATGKPIWARQLGGPGHDQAFGTAVDPAGNIIVAGTFMGIVDLGGGPLTSAGDQDVFLAKFSPTGTHLWSKRFGGAGDDEAYSVAVDGSGSIVIGGAFQVTADFGGTPLVSAGDYDGFVAHYSAAGEYLWAKRLGGPNADSVNSVAVETGGAVAATGYFNGTMDLGGGSLQSAGGSDIFVVHYSATGQHQWSRRAGGALDDVGNRLVLDGNGNVVLAGYFAGSADFGNGSLKSAGGTDLFVARYSATGLPIWSRRAGGQKDDLATAVSVDSGGNVVLTGEFRGTVDFGKGPLSAGDPFDVFLVRYSATGTPLWSNHYGGNAPVRASNLIADAAGTLVLLGSFNDMADLGGGMLAGGGIFVAKYRPDGSHLWSERFGGTENSDATGLALNQTGNILIAGAFQGTVDFGLGPLKSNGDYDGFVLELMP